MKVYETKEVPAHTCQVLTMVKCDLCGKEGKYGWESFHENVNDVDISVTVKHEHGSRWGDGGSTEACVVDLCPDCFEKKLVPWLQSQGANVKYEDRDY